MPMIRYLRSTRNQSTVEKSNTPQSIALTTDEFFLKPLKPPFLIRNLSYMPERKPQRKQLRKTFSIDKFMPDLQKRKLYFILHFTGIFDRTLRSELQTVQVSVSLLKKERHESENQRLNLGVVSVPINPNKNSVLSDAAKLIVSDKSDANSSLLSLCFSVKLSNKSAGDHLLDNCQFRTLSSSNSFTTASNSDSEDFIMTDNNKRKSLRSMHDNDKILCGDIQLYDRKNRLIPMGRKLEASLFEVSNASKKIHREMSNGSQTHQQLQQPFIQFFIYRSNKDICKSQKTSEMKQKKKPTIIYQFHYSNNSRQQTKTNVGLHCLWCMLDCMNVNALCMHLKLCHLRFHFVFCANDKGAKIDVYPSTQYDGSYEGSPFDLLIQYPGSAFSRNGQTKRVPKTEVLVYAKKSRKPKDASITSAVEEANSSRLFIDGHSRLYYHSATCLPIFPTEYDSDSESENDPEWLRERTQMMIDDFTDVNNGEKNIMKLWNLHSLKNKYVGDCYIPTACTSFIDESVEEIVDKQLYRNLLIHLANLVDFGLLNDCYFYSLILRLQRLIVSSNKHKRCFRNTYLAQKNLINPQCFNQSTNSFDFSSDPLYQSNDDICASPSSTSTSAITRRKLTDQNRKR